MAREAKRLAYQLAEAGLFHYAERDRAAEVIESFDPGLVSRPSSPHMQAYARKAWAERMVEENEQLRAANQRLRAALDQAHQEPPPAPSGPAPSLPPGWHIDEAQLGRFARSQAGAIIDAIDKAPNHARKLQIVSDKMIFLLKLIVSDIAQKVQQQS